ncbi:MAG: cytochrome c-type biogenesis protein CcmH [Burkholderiales bacterium]|nr:cytochrome c-type biogenesis protein CcmH [Burkholderiales bacterium]
MLGGAVAAQTGTPAAAASAPALAAPAAADPRLEARMMALATELRCLVCQNQTIADSHADLAVDLRQEIREMMLRGMSDAQIRHYMTERYGDFVLYKPPFKASTALLWLGPPAGLVLALAALFVTLRRRQRASPDAFDPDTPDDPGELGPAR